MFWLKLKIDAGYDRNFCMSDDWIHKLAKSAQSQKNRDQLEDQVRLHNSAIITAKSPSLWRALVESLETAVRTFQNEIGKDDMLLAMRIEFLWTTDSVIVRTSRFPQIQLDLQLDIAAQVIRYTFTRTQSSKAAPEIRSDEYHLSVERNDELCISDSVDSP